MNLIETVKSIFTDQEFMNDFNGMHVDYANNNKDCTGMFLANDKKISEDCIGNVSRSANFTIYRNVYNMNDIERIKNSSFILELSAFLESFNDRIKFEYQVGKKRVKEAYIEKITCQNPMMFQYLGGNPSNGAQYMLQIKVDYVVVD